LGVGCGANNFTPYKISCYEASQRGIKRKCEAAKVLQELKSYEEEEKWILVIFPQVPVLKEHLQLYEFELYILTLSYNKHCSVLSYGRKTGCYRIIRN
jgi:hypothetical protein